MDYPQGAECASLCRGDMVRYHLMGESIDRKTPCGKEVKKDGIV